MREWEGEDIKRKKILNLVAQISANILSNITGISWINVGVQRKDLNPAPVCYYKALIPRWTTVQTQPPVYRAGGSALLLLLSCPDGCAGHCH